MTFKSLYFALVTSALAIGLAACNNGGTQPANTSTPANASPNAGGPNGSAAGGGTGSAAGGAPASPNSPSGNPQR